MPRAPIHRLQRHQRLDHPLDTVFEFFVRAHNLERLTPPWLRFALVTPDPIEMRVGTRIEYRLHVHRVPFRWVSRIEEWDPGRSFVDRQLRGPYALWHHRHVFERDGDGTIVRDEVHYAMPLGRVGELAHPLLVRRDVRRIFDYRQAAVVHALA
ncbi:MAG TPA: SRPBCC family protein [Solirubrobacteraceae bacterium]